MAIYDAQLNNNSDRSVRQYADLDLFFGKKSSDRDVSEVTDIPLTLPLPFSFLFFAMYLQFPK